MTDWCILRTSGGRTLALADWLVAAGYEAWTPREMLPCRAGRNRERKERQAPILATFVFAPAAQLLSLAALRTMPTSQHPPFSIFRHAGRVPILSDRSMASLRDAEERAALKKLKASRHKAQVGSTIRMTEGPFAGLTGIVMDSTGKAARIRFGLNFEVEIASWRLLPDGVGSALPVQGMAARAV